MEEFKVTIDAFDGPLDLMLHLIKENQLDLMNLDMNVLTDQYIAYIEGMQRIHLEVVSEYMVEMAALVEYKSRKLLPGSQEEPEDEYEEDPKERLVRRLLEYQQFKEASEQLRGYFEERQEHMTRPVSNEMDQWIQDDETGHYKGNAYELMRAMKKCLMRMHIAIPRESSYTVSEISIEDRELAVQAKLARLPATFKMESLMDDVHDMPMFIATFLSILDLARLHRLVFTVDDQDTVWFQRGNRFS